jgi:Arc/MetJ family transcription regulator
MANVKRTSMFLDRELVTQAASALGTKGVTETIHAAMRHVVAVEAGTKLGDGIASGDIGVPSRAELRRWDADEA